MKKISFWVLAGVLSIMIAAGMQGNMNITDVVAEVCRQFKNGGLVFFFESPGESAHHCLDPPRRDAVLVETVFAIFFNGFGPG